MVHPQRLDHRASHRLATQLSSVAQRAKAHWGYPEAWLDEWRPELTFVVEDIKSNLVWGVEIDDRPVGFTLLSGVAPKSMRAAEPVVELEQMWIDPDYHGRGFGKALFSRLLDAANGSGADVLLMRANSRQQLGFGDRLGEEVVGPLRQARHDVGRLNLGAQEDDRQLFESSYSAALLGRRHSPTLAAS